MPSVARDSAGIGRSQGMRRKSGFFSLWRGLLTAPLFRPKVSKSTGGSADNDSVQKGTTMSILTRKPGWREVCLVLAILLILLLAASSCLLLLTWYFWANHIPWEPRAQLFAFFVELDLGAEPEDVDVLLQSDKYTLLRREKDDPHPHYAGFVRISTPFEGWAYHWILYLQFDDGLLVAKRIRISDAGGVHPSGAPDDEVAHADVRCPSWLEIRRE